MARVLILLLLVVSVFTLIKHEVVDDDLNTILNAISFRSLSWGAPWGRHLLNIIQNSPVFIPLGQKQFEEGDVAKANEFIMGQLSRRTANMLLYPYSFEKIVGYNVNGSISEKFPQGSIIRTTAEGLPDPTDAASFFRYIHDESSIDLIRAQALYDTSVAVLTLNAYFAGDTRDLFYESILYCTPFHTWANRFQECFSRSAFEQYLSSTTHPEQTSFVYVNNTDIAENFLLLNGKPRFGLLIIPDIYAGSEKLIASLFGFAGQTAINDYISAGGVVYANGKGALVLQELSLVNPGSFDVNNSLTVTGSTGSVNGCDPVDMPLDLSDETWARRVSCFSLIEDVNGDHLDALLGAPFVSKNTELIALSYWEVDETFGSRDIEGFVTPLSNLSAEYPHTLWKKQQKGSIFVNLGHPVSNVAYYPWLFNIYYYAMSRPMILDSEVQGGWEIIPGLEQLALDVDLNLKNIFSQNLSDVSYNVWIPNGFIIQDPLPDGCTKVLSPSTTPPSSGLQSSFMIDCSPDGGLIEHFSTISKTFNIFIDDILVTQKKTGIVILYPFVTYSLPDGRVFELDIGGVTIDARMAALIRADLNPDPSSHYPVRGKGQYIDNVLPAENKEDTTALDVVHVAIVPLISPIQDGDNQAMVLKTMDFDYLYYLKQFNDFEDYKYPFDQYKVNPRDGDFLDWRRLAHRNDRMAADWDTPVKIYKKTRGEAYVDLAAATLENITNLQYSTNIDNDKEVLEQLWFPDADNFYEHATQRLLAFLDTSTPEGFESFNVSRSWSGGKVDPRKINSRGDALRVPLSFSHNDIYFYNVRQKYPLPKGINDTDYVFSLDRYYDPSSCVSGLGNPKATKIVEGYFDYLKGTLDGSDFPPGLKPNEYSNELLTQCERKKIHVQSQNLQELSEITNSNVDLIHYLVRLPDNPNIQSGADILDFKEDPTNNDWYYAPGDMEDSRFGNYPELRAVWAFLTEFKISPALSRRGGKLVFTLPNEVTWAFDVDPIALNLVTYGADQIAILRSEFDRPSNTITTFFKRGNMPNEQYGKDSYMELNLERLQVNPTNLNTFDLNIDVYEMIYDLGFNPETSSDLDGNMPFERYITPARVSLPVTFTKSVALSMPALRMEFRLSRGDNETDSFLMAYEGLEPFVRYGIYMQELKAHRTIWGSAEVHPISDPGLVGVSGGFSWPSFIGISSIPFRHLLTTGSKQMIPSCSQTGRIEWKDIWGRKWIQPIRSVEVDVPPIPPPLRNFMMSTTFELLDPVANKRSLIWRSDDTMTVRAQVKLLNNYPKWWLITNCKENQVLQYAEGGVTTRIFLPINPSKFVSSTGNDNSMFINQGYNASYGACFFEDGSISSSVYLTNQMRADIYEATHCSATQEFYETCERLRDIPTITRRPATDLSGQTWNYAPRVERHWPDNFIKSNMWDLTHYDYDDTPMDKAYKYHMDNNLPNLDKKWLRRPHNILVFPIYKGLGYRMNYNNTLSHPNFPGFQGWWSDQLQNKDNTVVVGQPASSDVSVGHPDLTLEPGWIAIDQLTNVAKNWVDGALSNMYTCEFNRHRVRITPNNPISSNPDNVYQNNIIPVDHTLEKYDSRLYSYDCDLSKGQYSPSNISSYTENYLATDTARDWLYFAANLRGGAREDINILYSLSPIPERRHEGPTKVQDGGRFVYWNPANGPNSFLVVDNFVNVVPAQRTDIEIEQEIIPTVTSTFDALVYSLIKITDSAEIEREWPLDIYINHYGYGDAVVSMYVGGFRGSSNILAGITGDYTYCKIEFYNNAGFDWNLYANAINATELESKPISANDLMYRLKHAIRAPISYNFMTVHIPAELQPYVEIAPSLHNIDTAPLFFDFEFINVAQIRDGFKGQYYYKLVIKQDIPDELRGRLYHIPISLNAEYFEALPGTQLDPTNLPTHDYTLAVPDIVIGFPYKSDHLFANKVFYTSGYATDTKIYHPMPTDWTPDGALFVDEVTIRNLRDIASNPEGRLTALEEFWVDLISANLTNCPYTYTTSSVHHLVYDIGDIFGTFPIKKDPLSGPDQAELYILTRQIAPQIQQGTRIGSEKSAVVFNDFTDTAKFEITPSALTVECVGAYLQMTFSGILLTEYMVRLSDSRLYPNDKGIVRARLTALNVGTFIAYDVNITLNVAKDVTIMTEKLTVPYIITEYSTYNELNLLTHQELSPGVAASYYIYLHFDPYPEDATVPTRRYFVHGAKGIIDLTETPNERRVEQVIPASYSIRVLEEPRPRVLLYGSYDDDLKAVVLTAEMKELVTADPNDLSYLWRFKNPKEPGTPWHSLAVTRDRIFVDKNPSRLDIKEAIYICDVALGANFAALQNVAYNEFQLQNSRLVLFESNSFHWVFDGTTMSAIVGVVVGVPLVIIAGFFIWYYCFRAKKKFNEVVKEAYDIQKEVTAATVVSKGVKAGSKPGTYKKPTKEEKDLPVQHWGVKGSYIWTGVREVEVTDNVTGREEHKKEMRDQQEEWKKQNPDRVYRREITSETPLKYTWLEWVPVSMRPYFCCCRGCYGHVMHRYEDAQTNEADVELPVAEPNSTIKQGHVADTLKRIQTIDV